VSTQPRLQPHRRPLRRLSGGLQFGLEPGGVVLDGLSPAEMAFIESLDGTSSRAALVASGVVLGIDPDRALALLDLLERLGVLVGAPARLDCAGAPPGSSDLMRPDADALAAAYTRGDGYAVLARRRERFAVVDGHGPLARAVAGLLRRAGVGRVWSGRYAADAASQAGPPLAEGPARPDIVLLVAAGAVEAGRGEPWRRAGIAHLPVVLSAETALVGPVVRPGRSACLLCMDLTRAQLDPAWPSLLAQVMPAGVAYAAPVEGETTLASLAASAAAMMALARLDGQDPSLGVSVEARLPSPATVQRHWPAHPRCSCGAASGSAGGIAAAGPGGAAAAATRRSGPPDHGEQSPRATMVG
jgi:hypothetical protein